ncbi:MAG: efflux RND transporter periplasmic adaptor subunit [Mariprofundales bacterium]
MNITMIWMAALLLIASPAIAGEDGHNHAQGGDAHSDHEEEGGVIKLTAAQIKQGGIVTVQLRPQAKPQAINAPGTVGFNGYLSADVTTVVDAIVHARFVRLGDRVRKGDRLVTLNSTALAQAEASYLRAKAEHHRSKQEWVRLKKLAQQNIVSQARLQQAESTYQAMRANLAAAKATLFSYGLNREDIAGLMNQKIYGLLTLRAPNIGTVVADDFRIGQHLAAGSRLMQVVDESHVWVEVNIAETQLASIRIGQLAVVTPKGSNLRYTGSVSNIHHQLDAVTRTAGVRLTIANRDDGLHPGMFVQAEIAAGSRAKALLIPEAAVQRQGSELIVFIEEEPGHFERREVEVGEAKMGMMVIQKGVKAGESIVVKGTFVLASELAKAGFEVHNH